MANPRLGGHQHAPRQVFGAPGRPRRDRPGKPYLATLVSGACLVVTLAACSGPGSDTAADDTARSDRQASATAAPTPTPPPGDTSPHPYVGMWVTADGHIRQALLADGRYDEACGERESAYTGSYRVIGNRIEYADDTGFSAHGTFDGDVLHHAGYVFYREGSDAHRNAREDRP
ncbi:Atu4866 domain-containing protein [Micromonospora gifhornensis]|uniref:Atu4866 domain-containing protein n=1 Tax=Micromonospora gifhornensis TaxID=84594 RepID=UPI0034568723